MSLSRRAMQLLAVLVAGLWVAVAIALHVAYRAPGDAFQPGAALALLIPAVVALLAARWPPRVADGTPSAVAVGSVVGTALLLLPSIGALVGPPPFGTERLAPSAETLYTLAVAAGITSAFAAAGIAPRITHDAGRPTVAVGAVLALGLLVGSGVGLVYGTTRDEAAGTPPPGCSAPVGVASRARVTVSAMLEIDGAERADLAVDGVRVGRDERWTARLRTPWRTGAIEQVRVGDRAWRRDDGREWSPTTAPSAGGLDAAVAASISEAGRQTAAEDAGVEALRGRVVRHCRAAIRGPGGFEAFPTSRSLVGMEPSAADAALPFWQGELDWWIAAGGELEAASMTLHGLPPRTWPVSGLQGKLSARLDVFERDRPHVVEPPR